MYTTQSIPDLLIILLPLSILPRDNYNLHVCLFYRYTIKTSKPQSKHTLLHIQVMDTINLKVKPLMIHE